ncbi:MAG: tetratricopeptide repeat protein [Acinetobacter sp.]|jgi:predicted negative regulator of RcsB-dependent stress response|nr:MAG: tetratricopeptide repeat protein [Acinetobacter sp.]
MTAMTDDEQKEQLKSFIKRYGSPMLIGVLLALCVFFAWEWWHKNQQIKSSNLTVQYQNLLNQVNTASQDKATYQKFSTVANAIVSENPDSAQAVQAQLLLAKLAFDQKDYATAHKVLTQASNSKVDDDGLKAIVKLHLAQTLVEQNKLDDALKILNNIQVVGFTPSVEEAKGDIYVAKNDVEAAKKAYQHAWDELVKREQARELLQIKLANLGVLVADPKVDSPIHTPTQPALQPHADGS